MLDVDELGNSDAAKGLLERNREAGSAERDDAPTAEERGSSLRVPVEKDEPVYWEGREEDNKLLSERGAVVEEEEEAVKEEEEEE